MEYYYINTDWDALGYSPHDKWIELGHAFTSGDGSRCHYKKYGERVLGKLNSGDICLMYADGMGFVAAGKVCELWKGCAYKDEERWVYQHIPSIGFVSTGATHALTIRLTQWTFSAGNPEVH